MNDTKMPPVTTFISASLATDRRPKTFAEVVGQEHPVAYLSGLIMRGQVGRPVLLHGAVGSGKTTLARIYAQALLCAEPMADGSPCGQCAACEKVIAEDIGSGFYEYDVTGDGGDPARISAWVETTRLRAIGMPRRILFLDEAHGLANSAAESLLKRIEDGTDDVVYVFATSEHHNMLAALRSRLVPLRVRPLRRPHAVALLRRTADAFGVEADDEALVMLAGMVNGQPRDLLNAFSQLMVYEERITESTLRRIFDFEYVDQLRVYLQALGAQDRKKLNEVVLGWRDTAEEKLRWVMAALSGIYVTDILGLAVDVDPVVEQLATERRLCLESLRAAIGVLDNAELAPYWRKLLGHWRADLAVAENALIEAEFVAFHDLVVDAILSGSPLKSAAFVGRSDANRHSSTPTQEAFLTLGDVRHVLDTSSFLIQEYGLYFNAMFTVNSSGGAGSRLDQTGLKDRFCDALDAEFAGMGADRLGTLSTIEGSDEGIVGLIAVCLPESIGDNDVSGLEHLRRWYRTWEDEYLGEVQVRLETRDAKQPRERFHWRIVKKMLQALNPAIEAEDQDGTPRSVRELLRLSPSELREAAIAPSPLVRATGLLSPEAVELASGNGLAPLSPTADGAWSVIFDNWESQEHEDRRREREGREQQLAELAVQYVDPVARHRAEQRLRENWIADPHARKRSWATWWGQR